MRGPSNHREKHRTGKKPSPSTPPQDALGKQASPEAGRRAAAILEVLAGLRKPAEAAAALKVSVNHYYLLERKALAGLLSACEPQPKGPRTPGPQQQLASLERRLEECQRDCLRQAALVRATQRAVGLPAATASKTGGKANKKQAAGRRRRRPAVRALQAVRRLRKNSSGQDSPDKLEKPSTDGPVNSSSLVAEKERHDDASG